MEGKELAGRSECTFPTWSLFCAEHGHPPHLLDIPSREDQLCYMLVFGMRYRTQNSVRGDTVANALNAVGKGITNMGGLDPRKQVSGSNLNDPVLAAFLKRLRSEDDPSTRAYPANLTILRGLLDALDFEDAEHGTLNAHIIDLIIVAF